MMGFENIAVIGERELALGFKLVGIKDTFIKTGADAIKTFTELMGSKTYNLILVSESLKDAMDKSILRLAETSLTPLVVFIPLPGTERERESVESLAKRVLGVDIKGLKK
jgi:V/A-type H+/Na+-transporting ATPase subunit F